MIRKTFQLTSDKTDLFNKSIHIKEAIAPLATLWSPGPYPPVLIQYDFTV